jgi:hypothetical protein
MILRTFSLFFTGVVLDDFLTVTIADFVLFDTLTGFFFGGIVINSQ